MDHDAGDITFDEPSVVPDDPHVLEAVGRVAGLEGVAGPSCGDDLVDLAGVERGSCHEVEADEMGHVDVAVVAHALAVRQHGPLPRGPEGSEPDPPVDVLAEVDDVAILVQPDDRPRFDLLDPTDRRRG